MKLQNSWTIALVALLLLETEYSKGSSRANCNEGSIRLRSAGRNDRDRGRVEVCLDGHWGTVCDDGWDINDATTVCRELGHTDIKRPIPTRGAYFGQGKGPIRLSRAECRSNDTKLIDCTIDKTGMNECDHSEDAGVICVGPSSCEDGVVQLAGGESEREGRVEICYNGVWGTVCDDGWDVVDANVVCQQLGYGKPATINNSFEVGEGPPLLFNVTCNHTHTNLSQCVHPKSIGHRDCASRDKRAGVICPELADVYSTATVVLTTERNSNTEDIVSSDSPQEEKFRIISLSAAGGVLALVVITTICMCFVVVVIARRRKNKTKPGGSIDNPTYDEGHDLTPLAREVNQERDDQQRPIYSDVDAIPTTINAIVNQTYEGLYSDTTLVSEATYTNVNGNAPQDYLVPGTITNKQRQKDHGRVNHHNGTTAGEASEDTYMNVNGNTPQDYLVPETVNNKQCQRDHSRVNHHNGTAAGEGTTPPQSTSRDDNYSALGPTDYFTLQPHIPKTTEQQLPPANDDYSQLHHL